MPRNCASKPAMVSRRPACSVARAWARLWNNWRCRLRVFAASGSANSSGPNAMAGKPSLSAFKRASLASDARYWLRSDCICPRNGVSFKRNNTWPARTRSPSRTSIRSTIPPAGCCTVLRCPDTMTLPATATPLSNGASAAQPRKPAKPPSTSHQPRREYFCHPAPARCAAAH